MHRVGGTGHQIAKALAQREQALQVMHLQDGGGIGQATTSGQRPVRL
jgi:hypothetical protein